MNMVDIAVKRPVTVWMFTFAVLLFGFVSLSRLAVDLLPELSYPTLTIRTNYTGAAPGEIEQLVSKPIEETIGVVKGVRTVTSTSKAEQSDVVLEFEWGTEMDIASLEVREKLDVLQLPLDVEKPLLLRFNPSLDPIMRFGFGAIAAKEASDFIDLDVNSMKKLRVYAEEQIKRKLESVKGVASVRIGGGLENEIQVLVNQQRSSQLNITLAEIIQRLKTENVNTAGGRVEDGSQEYLVRTLNQFQTLDEMRDLFIATREGKHIRLGDIAEVQDTYKERSSVTRFQGFEGVEIAIYKEGDANTVKVSENVQRRLQEIEQEMPEIYQLQMVYDQSTFIANAVNEVKTSGMIGGILAMLVLFLFLKNVWPTLIISISIPVSIVATFNLMYSNDISLNIMSLGGIALAIGLLVDNSIVVLENIDRHKKKSKNSKKAAINGTKEVSMAIVASTLTTMAVFIPLVFVEGIAGQLFSDQALTVTFALAASLLVALSIIPMMAAREKSSALKSELDLGESQVKTKPTSKLGLVFYYILFVPKLAITGISKAIYFTLFVITSLTLLITRVVRKLLTILFTPILWAFDKVYQFLERLYISALRSALKARLVILTTVIVISGFSITLLPKLGLELIPPLSQGEFFVEINLPTGSKLENTDAILADLSRFAKALPEVERTYSLAGTGSLINASPSQGGNHWGRLNVVLNSETTEKQQKHVIHLMRDYLAQQAGVQSKFGEPELFNFSTPLEIQLSGYDLATLKKYSDVVVEEMKKVDRFADIKSTLQNGNPELKIQFNHAKLAQLGLNAPDVSNLISTKVGGEIATQYSIEDRKVDILVRTLEKQRDSITDISRIIINPGATNPIPLDAVADIDLSTGPSEITRVGQERVALISANLAYGDLGEAVFIAEDLLKKQQFPLSIQAQVTGQSEEMQNSFRSLQFALALAVFLVYLVMASQFESLLHPFLILFTVPLACAGSIYGLFVTGTSISVVVFIGVIMLAGIVVNNAIVLIDRINQLREKGEEKSQAIKRAAESRLRPILMTTMTTTLGLLPMAIGLGEGAEIRTPMAITVIFGLLFATFLTLFLIPVLYSLFDRKTFELAAIESTINGNEDTAYE
ncbi:efflux RND transporter permease subunit [Alteromonas sp. 5E99-2]|uniref:efflux RND transporter permease subunit n=1 Tax=Alteromonas sp. 5E99-2 TaxID=2817683 RepID=UPI001A98673E|nr:efflux RND transporter permease subunit [Alteromonas sp. 5E99-2]MBO1255674.1 efflux RND transporter permease subunit [Alteromonas sp. 5E99-2]